MQNQAISISEMEFGAIDARNEMFSRDVAKRKLFLDAFCSPQSFKFEDLLNGERFLICGPKGSGKTAFLRYLQNKLESKDLKQSRFIVFRDDVTSQDREKLVNLSNYRTYHSSDDDSENLGKDEERQKLHDCLNAWQLFIHREIAHVISTTGDLCAQSNDVKTYTNLLEGFFSQFKTGAYKKLLKKLERGRVKVSLLGQEIEAEASFVDIHGNIDVSEFVRYCNGVVSKLDFNSQISDARINIFFDELNVSYVNGKQFKSDAVLIRDLIAACGKLNQVFSENQIPIYIYSALRSEVVDSVEASVRELQKWIDDNAVHISWYDPTSKYEDQPIIDLLRQRVFANEKRLLGTQASKEHTHLSNYFEKKIFNLPFTHFLLFETWGRPRDLVRLLSIAAAYVPRGGKFGNEVFTKSQIEYSRSCWAEKADELNSKYSATEVETIKRILTNYRTSFNYLQLETLLSAKSANDPRANQFLKGRNLDVLLEDMYRVGILGNLLKTKSGSVFPKFLYTGLSNFSLAENICIHRSLWKELHLETNKTAIASELGKKKRRNQSPNSRRQSNRY
jgi:energy-coupling factor transporter ATP-binding protein EcfA2